MTSFQRHLRASLVPFLLSVVTASSTGITRELICHVGPNPDWLVQNLQGVQVSHVLLVHLKIREQHCLISQAGLVLHSPASVKSPINPWKTAFARKDENDFCLAENVVYCPLRYQPVLCPISEFFFLRLHIHSDPSLNCLSHPADSLNNESNKSLPCTRCIFV